MSQTSILGSLNMKTTDGAIRRRKDPWTPHLM